MTYLLWTKALSLYNHCVTMPREIQHFLKYSPYSEHPICFFCNCFCSLIQASKILHCILKVFCLLSFFFLYKRQRGIDFLLPPLLPQPWLDEARTSGLPHGRLALKYLGCHLLLPGCTLIRWVASRGVRAQTKHFTWDSGTPSGATHYIKLPSQASYI